jgi:RNA polymerase sigma factor (sigma-70 family)
MSELEVQLGATSGREEATAFLRGDPETVRRVRATVTAVVRFRGYFIPPEHRLDIAQDSLLDLTKALRRDPSLSFSSGFESFARTIAHRRCVDYVREARHAVDLNETSPPTQPDPEQAAIAAERLRLYRRVLQRISPSCRDLLKLREKGCRYDEIARASGRSAGALRVQFLECLKRAREIARDLARTHGPTSLHGDLPS